jgi:Dehydrogenases with different specificities (related to short-chain alcohol dehydrogenases)
MPRRVVVTGGGTGIGRSIAERFAADGDEVFILGRREEVLKQVAAEHPDARIHPLRVDLTVPDEVLEVPRQLSAEPVDVLVNNAGGVIRDTAEGLAGVFDEYRRTVELNLLSAMMLTRALWPGLRRPGARVVNISSIAAQRGGGEAYGAAKAGLIAWAAGLAKEGGPDGITVNTVAPGYVQDTEFFSPRGRSSRHDQLVAETLLGRAGTPADIAAAVHFLASEGASWITGQVLSVNGGALLGR